MYIARGLSFHFGRLGDAAADAISADAVTANIAEVDVSAFTATAALHGPFCEGQSIF